MEALVLVGYFRIACSWCCRHVLAERFNRSICEQYIYCICAGLCYMAECPVEPASAVLLSVIAIQ